MTTGKRFPRGDAKELKYVYIKNGDVVEQLRTISADPNRARTGGPDAFIADFLRMVSDQPTLLMSCYNRDAALRIGNIEAQVFNFHSNNNIFLKSLRRLWIYLLVFKKMIQFHPDRIVCGRPGALLWVCYIVSRLYTIPFIHSRHVSVHTGSKSLILRITNSIDNLVLREASAIVCHGPYTKRLLLEEGLPESKILEFDVTYPDLASEPSNTPNTTPAPFRTNTQRSTILYLGRIVGDKGVFDLLDACVSLLRADRDLTLVYVGDGPAFTDLQHRIQHYDLQRQVILWGRVPHEDVGAILRQGQVVVTPTKQAKEGRCMSAMEALALGIPVIAPNGGPFPYLIEDGNNGLLYTVDSNEDLHEKLTMVLNDSILYSQLKQGALKSRGKLFEPAATFASAIKIGFAQSVQQR